MSEAREQAWITGIGLVSSLGEGIDAHWRALAGNESPRPVIENERFAPYPIHPLADLDFSKEIPRKSDQKQMERWQRIGVYAAGLALSDAGLTQDQSLLDRTDLCIAAGNGERDLALDSHILADIAAAEHPGSFLNSELASGLRPTLYLGQLSNLLAGNISIIHKATGSSRTFKGEEMAGVSAAANALNRIAAGQGELYLVGGALNAEREDLLLGCELGSSISSGPYHSVWERRKAGGGLVPGSVGAFLVLESSTHARARGAMPYARLSTVLSDRSPRAPGDAARTIAKLFDTLQLDEPREGRALLSGASGGEPATSEEAQFLADLQERGLGLAARAWGNMLGHGIEAHFIVGLALAATAISKESFFPPFDPACETQFNGDLYQIVVTCLGHWRGEGIGLVETAW